MLALVVLDLEPTTSSLSAAAVSAAAAAAAALGWRETLRFDGGTENAAIEHDFPIKPAFLGTACTNRGLFLLDVFQNTEDPRRRIIVVVKTNLQWLYCEAADSFILLC
jgi:hypothetical protein